MIITLYKHKHLLFSPPHPSETPITQHTETQRKWLLMSNYKLKMKKKKKVEGEDISMFSTQATILCLAHIFSALALSGVCNGP